MRKPFCCGSGVIPDYINYTAFDKMRAEVSVRFVRMAKSRKCDSKESPKKGVHALSYFISKVGAEMEKF